MISLDYYKPPPFDGSTLHAVSFSGGKDSTATLLCAMETARERGERVVAAFCDTGHEHPFTVAYAEEITQALGVSLEVLRADFSEQIQRKRERIVEKWPADVAARALKVLHPTGNPFLDLCLWKGRFPSMRAKFCTPELKQNPLREWQMSQPEARIVAWVGVRRGESRSRSNALAWESDLPDGDAGVWINRPIVEWSAGDVFHAHAECGVQPNPLYRLGMGRVGCMPCIAARKNELAEIAKRFPEEVDRVAEWERLVSEASKMGCATLFAVSDDPMWNDGDPMSHEKNGIRARALWAQTSRGGRQLDMVRMQEGPACSSMYGLCE